MNRRVPRGAAPRALLLALAAASAAAQPVPSPAASPVDPSAGAAAIPAIMARDWIGTPPTRPYFSDDGRALFYEQRRAGSRVFDLHRVELGSGKDTIVPAGERGSADAPGGVYSRDRRFKAWVREGDVFARELPRGAIRQLTRTSDEERDPLWLEEPRRVAFRRGDSFYTIDWASGLPSTLADLELADDPAPQPSHGFLAEQELRLFETLRGRRERADAERAARSDARRADSTRAPEPWWLGKGAELRLAVLSPSGRHVAVVLGAAHGEGHGQGGEGGEGDEDVGAEGGKRDAMAVFVTESGYVDVQTVRPKVGTGAPETPVVALLDLATRRRTDLDLATLPGVAEDPLAGLRARNGEAAEGSPEAVAAPRPLAVHELLWNDDGSRLALQIFSRDFKDRWLAVVDPAGPRLEPVERQSDPAWLGWRFDEFGWMKDGRTLWFLSEETGWSQLYLHPLGGARRALTAGPFEIDRPRLSRDGASFLVEANREQAGIVEIYRVDAARGAIERLSTHGGLARELAVASDERQIAFLGSATTAPPELFVQPARPGATAKRLTHSTTPAFDAVEWVRPEIVAVPSRHGAGSIAARLYLPPGPAATAPRPAVVFVHGAGYLQNAHLGWSYYAREFMFHTLLARRGYVVLDMDYRASAGYGRAWRTAIYRQMGHPELEDLEDGVAWLAATQGVDAQRVGVYGGSYGGFLTFMALFRRPELFAAGAALRPVADWAHYNHDYTAAILNTPEVDPEAYRRSSPIEYAAGLSRPLLICHGMVDDNVVFQDTVRLVQRLIELGKTDLFETAIYPVEGHAFREPSSWTDEYTRIWRLFERTLW